MIGCKIRSNADGPFFEFPNIFIVLVLLVLTPQCSAEDGRLRAVLIGIRNYEHAPNLPYTVNDIERLGETLTERCGRAQPLAVEWIDDRFDDISVCC